MNTKYNSRPHNVILSNTVEQTFIPSKYSFNFFNEYLSELDKKLAQEKPVYFRSGNKISFKSQKNRMFCTGTSLQCSVLCCHSKATTL